MNVGRNASGQRVDRLRDAVDVRFTLTRDKGDLVTRFTRQSWRKVLVLAGHVLVDE